MKTIIVTDPCYVISDKDWKRLIDEAEEESGEDWINCFDNIIAKFLIEISGDKHSVAGSTGYGDWQNEIDGQPFYADSGMVCVVGDSDLLRSYFVENGIVLPLGGAAELEVEDNSTYKIDVSNPHWSVVRINSGGHIIASLPSEEES